MNIQKVHKKVLKELQAIAFTSIADICTWNEESVQILPQNKIAKKYSSAIAEIKQDTSKHSISVKMFSKIKALEILAKYCSEHKTESTISSEEIVCNELQEFLQGINT